MLGILARLYRGSLASQVRHHAAYASPARDLQLVPDAELDGRLKDLAAHEATVIADAPDVVRMHS